MTVNDRVYETKTSQALRQESAQALYDIAMTVAQLATKSPTI